MLSDVPNATFRVADNPKPPAEAVSDFHTNSDVDTRPEAQHHTLGPGANQAAPGNHRHDGGDSEKLLVGEIITGTRGGEEWCQSINNILVKMGATNNSTAAEA
jgi:hypothetical protein